MPLELSGTIVRRFGLLSRSTPMAVESFDEIRSWSSRDRNSGATSYHEGGAIDDAIPCTSSIGRAVGAGCPLDPRRRRPRSTPSAPVPEGEPEHSASHARYVVGIGSGKGVSWGTLGYIALPPRGCTMAGTRGGRTMSSTSPTISQVSRSSAARGYPRCGRCRVRRARPHS